MLLILKFCIEMPLIKHESIIIDGYLKYFRFDVLNTSYENWALI